MTPENQTAPYTNGADQGATEEWLDDLRKIIWNREIPSLERIDAAQQILGWLSPLVDQAISANAKPVAVLGEKHERYLIEAIGLLEQTVRVDTIADAAQKLAESKGAHRDQLIKHISARLDKALIEQVVPPTVLTGEDKWLRKDLPPRLIWNTERCGAADNNNRRFWEYPPAGICHSECVTVLAGAGGTGKSRLALQLAITMSRDGPESEIERDDISGLTVSTGPVVVLTFEDTPERLFYVRKRLMADMGIAEAPRRLSLVEMEDRCLFGPPRNYMGNASNVEPVRTEYWEPTWQAVRALKPRLVVLDNVGYAFSTPSASAEAVRAFLKSLEEEAKKISCGMLLVCHTSKDSRKKQMTDPMGSAAWSDAARGVLGLAKTCKDDAFTGIIMRAEKSNYGPDDWRIGLRGVDGIGRQRGGGAWEALPNDQAFPSEDAAQHVKEVAENELSRRFTGRNLRSMTRPSDPEDTPLKHIHEDTQEDIPF